MNMIEGQGCAKINPITDPDSHLQITSNHLGVPFGALHILTGLSIGHQQVSERQNLRLLWPFRMGSYSFLRFTIWFLKVSATCLLGFHYITEDIPAHKREFSRPQDSSESFEPCIFRGSFGSSRATRAQGSGTRSHGASSPATSAAATACPAAESNLSLAGSRVPLRIPCGSLPEETIWHRSGSTSKNNSIRNFGDMAQAETKRVEV